MSAVITLIICMTILFAQVMVLEQLSWAWFPVFVIGSLLFLLPTMLRISHAAALAKAGPRPTDSEQHARPKWKKIAAIAGPIAAGGGLSIVISLAAWLFNVPSLEDQKDQYEQNQALEQENQELRRRLEEAGLPTWP